MSEWSLRCFKSRNILNLNHIFKASTCQSPQRWNSPPVNLCFFFLFFFYISNGCVLHRQQIVFVFQRYLVYFDSKTDHINFIAYGLSNWGMPKLRQKWRYIMNIAKEIVLWNIFHKPLFLSLYYGYNYTADLR